MPPVPKSEGPGAPSAWFGKITRPRSPAHAPIEWKIDIVHIQLALRFLPRLVRVRRRNTLVRLLLLFEDDRDVWKIRAKLLDERICP